MPLALLDGGLIAILLFIVGGVISLAATVFWLWMLFEAALKEPSEGSDKIVWVLLIILLPFIGSLLYFFVRRPQRITQTGR